MNRVLWVAPLALAIAWPLSARADGTQVFPLEAEELPSDLGSLPQTLTARLASELGGTVAEVQLQDAAGLLECDPEATPCLELVARSLGATRLVFGRATGKAGSVEVSLSVFESGGEARSRAFTLKAEAAEAMASKLVTESKPLFDPDPPPPAPDPIGSPPPPAKETPESPSLLSRVPIYAWAVAGGGVILTGVGAGFLISADGLRHDVETAPTETREQIEALRELEDRGSSRTLIGNGLVVIGGLAIATGATLAILEIRSPATERATVRVDPVPLRGGVGVVVTLEGM